MIHHFLRILHERRANTSIFLLLWHSIGNLKIIISSRWSRHNTWFHCHHNSILPILSSLYMPSTLLTNNICHFTCNIDIYLPWDIINKFSIIILILPIIKIIFSDSRCLLTLLAFACGSSNSSLWAYAHGHIQDKYT